MNKRDKRNTIIQEIILSHSVSNQEDMLRLLSERGCVLTQATLSRSLKQMKVVKRALPDGSYRYELPEKDRMPQYEVNAQEKGFLSIAFSGKMAVVKTRPGYASRLAYEIDEKAADVVIGTVAGEDTILLVIEENATREQVIDKLSGFIKI